MNDPLGDRMKMYEGMTEKVLMPNLPTLARVDGRAFHTFTRGMERPYDMRMVQVMQTTAKKLAQETRANMTYTQSDEITLMWYNSDIKTEFWFGGRHSKMVSQVAALATLYFYRACLEIMPEYVDKLPTFDGRVWQVPNLKEAANAFLWRERDATKNSITMAASAYYSHKELQGKNGSEKQEMLFEKGINWDNYPPFFKRGSYIQRRIVELPFDEEELANLPPRHAARLNPNLIVRRSKWEVIDMPPIGTIKNKEEVISAGAEWQNIG